MEKLLAAASSGDPQAQQNLELVARKLSREQLAAAQAAMARTIQRTQTDRRGGRRSYGE